MRPQADTSARSGGTQGRGEDGLPLTASAVDAAVPAVAALLAAPTVCGALESVLGLGYFRHPHSAITVDPEAPEAATLAGDEAAWGQDQGWHRDSYAGVQRARHHRPRWVFCMYFPAAVDIDMGPFAVVPGSQYCSADGDGEGAADAPAPAVRYDLLDDPAGLMRGPDLAARDALLARTLGGILPPGR